MTEPTPLSGSERPLPPENEYVGPADPHDTLVVSIYVDMPEAPTVEPEGGQAEARAAPEVTAHIAAVAQWARDNGLEVVDSDPVVGRIRVVGSVAALERAFGVRLRRYRRNGITFVAHEGPVQLPRQLHPAVRAVLGLDTRPVARR